MALGQFASLLGSFMRPQPGAPAQAYSPLRPMWGSQIGGGGVQRTPGGAPLITNSLGGMPAGVPFKPITGVPQMTDAGGMRSPLPMGSMLGPANLPAQAKAYGARRRFA